MYIKQIIIQGFKSYKEQTVIEPFSPKHNVIVGRNGSGKSNFFAAIRFVLSDEYTQLNREERSALLHEGAGSAVMSAYVEVIFDNSDERFPTGTKDVILRRTVGQKKDEYSLNRKNTTKQEIMNLLESAGFSKSNPYYIVPQGRVTQITNMQDPQRLAVLKEVAGTEVYEKRRAESRRIMDDTEQKRGKIDETLDHIRQRLGELEEEKKELHEFQEKDRERRCLEYTIHRQEQDALNDAMEKLNEERESGNERTDENSAQLQQQDIELEAIDDEMSELQQQLRMLQEEKAQLETDRKESAKEKAKIELDVQSMTDNQSAAQQAQTQHAAELKDVQAQIAQRENELAQLLPQYTAKRAEDKTARQELQDAEQTIQRLYAKQGRQAQFKNKRDRDAWLNSTIADINDSLATRKAIVMNSNEEIAELETQIGQLETEIATLRSRNENRGDEQQGLSAEVQRAKDEQHRLTDRRKELWREEAKLTSVIENAKQELDKAQSFLHRMMDQSTSRGLQNVRRIVQKHNIEGAHGTLGELFEFSGKYQTAIEVTAGTSLFNYVVDDDEVSTRITEILKKEKGGRVTFVPLSRIQNRGAPNLPKASDAVPLLSKLKYDAIYEPAFRQVFGKTIVCPNLQVAAQYARSHGVSAITPDGDQSDKKGALTGGWHDVRSSRIDGLKREKTAREEWESATERKAEVVREVDEVTQLITRCLGDVQRVEQKRMQLDNGYAPLQQELQRRNEDLNAKKDELDAKIRHRENVEGTVHDLGEQLAGYQTELAGDFKKALSNEEERLLESTNAELSDLRKAANALSAERGELEGRKSMLESELRENLRLRLDQLMAAGLDASGDGNTRGSGKGSAATRLKERQRDLKRVSSALASLSNALAENESSIEAAQESLQTTIQKHEDKKASIDRLRTAIASHQKSISKAANKRSLLSSRQAEVALSIRNLGVLPDAAMKSDKYLNMSAASATKKLHAAQEGLKKFGHVNKKAYEQFAQFEKQRDLLEDRRRELGKSDDAIRDLIDVLDARKDEAIERTFRQVSREFAGIFERLVPTGRGKLVIQRRSDKQANARNGEDDNDNDGEAERAGGGGVESYTGVGISVSFNSKHDEQQRIQQLSGGQKSLCALALVLAIQASDPAPFYLFDEIDANLDAQYRTAVAEMIRKSANGEEGASQSQGGSGGGGGQFICTTFRPEMVLVAEKCYGVSYANKTSAIDVVSRDQALDFVEGQVGGR
ncbi:Structural maintenance of chromosomes protein 3 [Saxophila tyrrhenica]|uniref:Structural maintenance of chromosomes protein n=1 Tax=Saxophila tyrrhenica TaxID=1690608 RepID=A0AAV9PBA1_9PEZI|nr:Structural maintenance of chromosomes protein 3 [Saxophila tyrrhenica]